jgi:hypothetical protein
VVLQPHLAVGFDVRLRRMPAWTAGPIDETPATEAPTAVVIPEGMMFSIGAGLSFKQPFR